MKIHPAKTKYSIISTRQKIANSPKQTLDLSVDGMQLTKVESERVLGVYIDSHLTWNEHIDILRRKLLQRIAILGRARKYLPIKYRLLLYNACIKPLFTYCCTVWSNCSQTNLDELFKLQKRCARLILDSPWDARSFDNFQKLKWLPLDQMFKINKLGLLKKVIDGRAGRNGNAVREQMNWWVPSTFSYATVRLNLRKWEKISMIYRINMSYLSLILSL